MLAAERLPGSLRAGDALVQAVLLAQQHLGAGVRVRGWGLGLGLGLGIGCGFGFGFRLGLEG